MVTLEHNCFPNLKKNMIELFQIYVETGIQSVLKQLLRIIELTLRFTNFSSFERTAKVFKSADIVPLENLCL